MNVDILLDVDGCLLATCDKERGGMAGVPTGWDDWQPWEPSDGWQVYSPTMLAWIARWSQMRGVTMHWCTSWCERADEVLAPAVGLPRGWNVLHRERAPEYLDGRPDNAVVWIDDDLLIDKSTRDWFEANEARALGVEPNPWWGVHRMQMEAVEDWMTHRLFRC